jgi:hypothetical protein
MNWAHRIPHGVELERRLQIEVAGLAKHHPRGFAVRLHVLGDFYSVGYIALWRELLERHPAPHIWGYTARIDVETDPIATALVALTQQQWIVVSECAFRMRRNRWVCRPPSQLSILFRWRMTLLPPYALKKSERPKAVRPARSAGTARNASPSSNISLAPWVRDQKPSPFPRAAAAAITSALRPWHRSRSSF